MKTITLLLLGVIILAGCSRNAALVRQAETAVRGNVCAVVAPQAPPEKGYANIVIRASLKTHGVPTIPFGGDTHGTAGYSLVVNVDGEPLRLCGEKRPEGDGTLPVRHPEAGEGVRYLFRTHVRLKTGAHRIIVALPGDAVATERDISLTDGTDNTLGVTPRYCSDRFRVGRGSAGATSFREGICGVSLSLNGEEI